MPYNKDKTSVLVVEDEPLIFFDAVDMVEHAGLKAYEARNAMEALDCLTEHDDIGVLLTDIDMPGPLDGLDLARLVRERWPHIAIIIVSGHIRLTAADMPAEGQFLSKPYMRAAILRALRNVEGLH